MTILDSRYELYLDRLVDRIKLEQGITFEEFRAFCQFLNNLDDFNVAMKMYTLADRPISQDEFRRAVRICTGTDLSPHVVETVFQIFDEDDDGHLSHREFIGVMKDRLHRGFKVHNLLIDNYTLQYMYPFTHNNEYLHYSSTPKTKAGKLSNNAFAKK